MKANTKASSNNLLLFTMSNPLRLRRPVAVVRRCLTLLAVLQVRCNVRIISLCTTGSIAA
ncbi:MAG: hypothetical protein ACRC7P_08720 [Enterovibrio sp.]